MRLQWHLECLAQPWFGLGFSWGGGGAGRDGTGSASIHSSEDNVEVVAIEFVILKKIYFHANRLKEIFI